MILLFKFLARRAWLPQGRLNSRRVLCYLGSSSWPSGRFDLAHCNASGAEPMRCLPSAG
jgi:hypothetical protein